MFKSLASGKLQLSLPGGRLAVARQCVSRQVSGLASFKPPKAQNEPNVSYSV